LPSSLRIDIHSNELSNKPKKLKGVSPMLVLSRKENERLVIDGNIVVTVVRVAGGKVRLGIEAPADVQVKREELLDKPMRLDPPHPIARV
jgi:carbon storage regulator